jgi:hypothetical protein
MRPDKPRDPVAGPDAGPESPYPVRLSGPVIKGFGRGSKDVCRAARSCGFLQDETLRWSIANIGLCS